MKRCTSCRRELPLDRFASDTTKRQGRQSRCRDCDGDLRIQRIYGISRETWELMLIGQSGRCAICGDELREPKVDHDHATGVVRELLCHLCNTGIGALRESPPVFRAALRYLELHAQEAAP